MCVYNVFIAIVLKNVIDRSGGSPGGLAHPPGSGEAHGASSRTQDVDVPAGPPGHSLTPAHPAQPPDSTAPPPVTPRRP